MENIVQPIPIKAPLLAVGKAVCLSHTPFHQRIAEVADTLRFIGGNTDILNQLVFLCQIAEIAVNDPLFQHGSTPTVSGTRPTITFATEQFGVLSPGHMLQKQVLKGIFGLEPGDWSADILFQFFNVVVHTVKLKPRIAEQNEIDRPSFLQHPQKHCC